MVLMRVFSRQRRSKLGGRGDLHDSIGGFVALNRALLLAMLNGWGRSTQAAQKHRDAGPGLLIIPIVPLRHHEGPATTMEGTVRCASPCNDISAKILECGKVRKSLLQTDSQRQSNSTETSVLCLPAYN